MNLIPSIIYVQVFILWSLFRLILRVIVPFILPTRAKNGRKAMIRLTTRIPGQPKRVTKIEIIPIKIKGAAKAARKVCDFV